MRSESPVERSYIPLFVALMTPFITLLMFEERVISWDINAFRNWAECLRQHSCPLGIVNYPTLGLWSSGGALWVFEFLVGNSPRLPVLFQRYLGVVDALNLLLMYLLLRGIGVTRASWLTLLFAILPSTRVGGNLWAQIDDVTQLFLSTGSLCGLRGLRAVAKADSDATLRYLTGFSLCAGFALLTKQLALFSLPGLGLLGLFLAVRASRICSLMSVILAILFAGTLTMFVDQLSPTPPGFFGSSLYYILAVGSKHGSSISAAGLSLYTLLPLPLTGDSYATYPWFSAFGRTVMITPFYFGLTLFFTACGLMTWWSIKLFQANKGPSAVQITTFTLAIAALCNLIMNTVLSGTHERYLYHYGFFVFPVICLLFQRGALSALLVATCLIHLTVYGLFVYWVLRSQSHLLVPVLARDFIAALNIALCFVGLWKLHAASKLSSNRSIITRGTV